MENPNYSENYKKLSELFPGSVSITPKEAAEVLSSNIKTIYSAMNRELNPLPSVKVSKRKRVIPIAGFARWLSS